LNPFGPCDSFGAVAWSITGLEFIYAIIWLGGLLVFGVGLLIGSS
jgi:hypothetical protein